MCLPAGVIHLFCLHLHFITLKTIGSLLVYAFSIPTLSQVSFSNYFLKKFLSLLH